MEPQKQLTLPEYAIAGTHEEFKDWQRERPDSRRKVKYLSSPDGLMGLPDGWLHRIGRWQNQHPEIKSHAEMLVCRLQWELERDGKIGDLVPPRQQLEVLDAHLGRAIGCAIEIQNTKDHHLFTDLVSNVEVVQTFIRELITRTFP